MGEPEKPVPIPQKLLDRGLFNEDFVCDSLVCCSFQLLFLASTAASAVDLTGTFYGYLGIAIFVLAYSLVPLENNIHLRKSKPVLLAAGLIWCFWR